MNHVRQMGTTHEFIAAARSSAEEGVAYFEQNFLHGRDAGPDDIMRRVKDIAGSLGAPYFQISMSYNELSVFIPSEEKNVHQALAHIARHYDLL